MPRFFILLILLFFLFSCGSEDKNTTVIDKDTSAYDTDSVRFITVFKYTKNINIQHFANYQIVYLLNPWNQNDTLISYLLFPRGIKLDNVSANVDYKIAVPIKSAATLTASSIGFFDIMNKLELISAVSKRKYVYNAFIRDEIEKGRIKELGEFEQINLEQLISIRPDVLIKSPYGADLSADKKLSSTGVPIIYNSDWIENNPLGRAEWIKFFALLVGMESFADSAFTQIENRYLRLKKEAEIFDNHSSVIIGGLFKDVWFMPGGESYKAQLLADASVNYYWKKEKASASLPLSFEVVVKNQIDADFWIEAPAVSYSDLLKSNSRYGIFHAFKSKRVYHSRKQFRPDGANNYWERAVCRPDELLSDIINISHGDSDDSSLIYYDNLK